MDPNSRSQSRDEPAARASQRRRVVTTTRFPRSRAVVTQALRAGRSKSMVHGIVGLDVTEAKRRLAAMEPAGSVTAFIVAAVAAAAHNHPQVHAYRDWRRRLVTHSYVDVATMFEVQRGDGPLPLAHLIRDADARTVADITAEIRTVQAHPERSPSGRTFGTPLRVAGRVPGLMSLLYRVLSSSAAARQMSGTVSVTSIGMFAGGGGAGISQPTIHSLTAVVGGISERPVVIDGEITVRQILDLTVSVDHNIVDGAPAARFMADLRRLVEEPAWID